MANEATLRDRLADPVDMTVDNAVGIEKGALLYMVDPRTASGSSAALQGNAFAGVAAREKIALDGRTQLAVFRQGIFDMVAVSGSGISTGTPVKLSGANTIAAADTGSVMSGAIVGIALEDELDGETIQVILGV